MTQRPESDPGIATPGGTARRQRRAAMSARDEEILRSLAGRIDPEDAGAHNNLGVVFYQKGLVEDAIRAFERALELDPHLEVARSNVEAAYLESGYFQQRVSVLRERARRDPSDAEARDALARTFLLGGEPGAAAREWALLLEEDPRSPDLHMKLAFAESEQGRLPEALRFVDRALELEPTAPALHLQRAELLEEAGETRGALAAARRALELDDGMARAHLLLARLLEADGREPEARSARERATQLDPGLAAGDRHLSLERYLSVRDVRSRREPRPGTVDASLGRLARAAELRQAGDLEGAAAELERALAETGRTFEARQALAEVRLLQGRLEDALDLYDALLADEEESPKLWNERGVAFHRLGRLEKAVDAYRHAVAMDYAYALGWNNLGVARAQLGEDGAAERALRKAADDAATLEILWNLGLFLNLHGQIEESVEVYRAAVREDGTRAESWGRLGSVLFQSDRATEARESLERALELDPGLAEARYQLGFVLSALGDFKGALRQTKKAMEQEAVFPAPRYRLLIDVQFEDGSLPAPDAEAPERVAAGEPIEAFDLDDGALDRAFAGLAIEREPGQVEAILEEARTALRLGKLDQAADRAARAVALAPSAPGPRLLQARIYLDQGLAGEALERYAEVGERGPGEHAREAAEGKVRALLVLGRAREAVPAAEVAVSHGAPRALLGRALLQAGDPEAAVAVFEEATESGDRSAETVRAHGQALLEADRPTDAEPRFRAALAESPSAAAHVGLARTLEALGNWEGAEAAYERAVETLPSYGPAALGLAELQWSAGRHVDALQTLVTFLELDPAHVDGLVRLGRWLSALGRSEQAVRALERALRLAPDHEAARVELERIGGR